MGSETKPYFSYEQDGGLTFHSTEDEARKAAEAELDTYRDISGDDGWPESVTEICYGLVIAEVKQTSYTPRPPADEIDDEGIDNHGNCWTEDHWSHIADYGLKPINSTADLAAIKGERDRLKEAVEHYADKSSYLKSYDCGTIYRPGGNGYDIARAALEEKQNVPAYEPDVAEGGTE